MQYRRLGRTGLQISRISLGSMTFGREADQAACADILDAALDAGINCIDCADIYADGASERVLGELLGARRHQLILTSKVGGPVGPTVNDRGCSRRHIVASCEASLQRLGTDHLDCYFLHYYDDQVDPEIPLRALDELIAAGKIRYAGASNFAAWQLARSLGIGERLALEPIRVIQPMYSLLKRQAEVEILPLAQAVGLGVISYSPMAAGILSGKYRERYLAAEGRLTSDAKYQGRYADPEQYRIARRFADLAAAADWPAPALAVRWACRHPAISSVITGARRLEQLQPILDNADRPLDDDLYRTVAELVPAPPMATDRDEERA